jgi:hypothetical protein
MILSEYATGHSEVPTTLVEYGESINNGVDEVCKLPGARFELGGLLQGYIENPVVVDSGAILVQTIGEDNVRNKFFIDEEHAIDPKKPWLVANIRAFRKAHPSNAITIGQPWISPFGTTNPVEAVAIPYTHGITDFQELSQRPDIKKSVTYTGRIALLKATGQSTDAYNL